jgi:hypothetical protein
MLTGHRSPGVLIGRGPPSLLSQFLSHSRPGPFTSVRSDRVCAVHGRWRTSVNAGQHYWKACWGQPLGSSNLYPPPPLTCDDAHGSCSRAALHPKHVSHFVFQLSPDLISYSGQIGVMARRDGARCAWSGTSRTYLNGMAHAAKSCASGQSAKFQHGPASGAGVGGDRIARCRRQSWHGRFHIA